MQWVGANNLAKLPAQTGVYLFRSKEGILYIGKAANIRNRVKNHFNQPTFRDTLFINRVTGIGYQVTSSEIEALLLEAKLIKKYRPKYNVMWKDDKGYFYVVITKDKLPRILIMHRPNSSRLHVARSPSPHATCHEPRASYLGPFTDGRALKKTLRFLRRIFPYYTQNKHPLLPCPWCHLELCPGPNPDPKQYRKNIHAIRNILLGKSSLTLKSLKKEMVLASKKQRYEKAAAIRDQIQALENVIENAKILSWENWDPNLTFQAYTFFVRRLGWESIERELRKILNTKGGISRIEGYDVSNIQGQQATGAMIVFINGKLAKNLYRKFKIKISGRPNDTAMIKETLSRRLRHAEWELPEVMLIDGGKAQLNAALDARKEVLKYLRVFLYRGNCTEKFEKIKIIALAKRRNQLFIEGRKKPILLKNCPPEVANLLLHLRDEAHRFSRAYHHYLRSKSFK